MGEEDQQLLECPRCGYLITEREMELSYLNYDCPECHKTRFSEFVRYKDE